MRNLRGRLLPRGAGLVVMCGTAGVAQAATPNVRTAIKTQDRIIRRSPEYAKLKNISIQTPAEAAPVIKALGALHASLEHAATVVSKSSTTSARQRTGRGEWVAAARQLAHGLSQLQAALRDPNTATRRAPRRCSPSPIGRWPRPAWPERGPTSCSVCPRATEDVDGAAPR